MEEIVSFLQEMYNITEIAQKGHWHMLLIYDLNTDYTLESIS